MDLKKSNSANLEKREGTRFILGLIVSLSIILISFEWTILSPDMSRINTAKEIEYDIEMIELIRREEPKPLPKEELPPIDDVIEIVDDDYEIEIDYSFDREVDRGTEYIFKNFSDEGTEIVIEEIDFVIVEEMPLFNGGDPRIEFYRYIVRHLKYPEIAAENGVSGKVQVQFVVNAKGFVERATITRSVDPALDQEALRVILSSPKWTPGKQRGKAVNVIYTFPINFVLQ
ncbi:MAG: energy transducer TonB [Bacteroidota bacterium]